MNKKVLIFATVYFPFMSGAEMAVKEITDRLQKDFEFDLITAQIDKKLPPKEKIGNIFVYRVGIGHKTLDKFLLPFLGFFLSLKLYKEKKYQIVWALMASQASLGASFLKILKPKIKLLLTLQEGDEESHLKRYVGGNNFLYKILIRPWHRLVFKKADLIQTISSALKNRAIGSGAKCEIEVVPNGVAMDIFTKKYSSKALNLLKESLNKKEDDIFIIHTGRFNYKNALDDLIVALVYLPENIKLLLIGNGEEEEKLKKIVEERNLDERVQFIDFVNQAELAKYLKISDIFMRPSLAEGLGNSFLEAMMAKVPVIATPVGGILDFLKEKETGLFCRVRDPESIAAQVQILLENENLRNSLVENAYKMVVAKYNWDKIAQDMRKLFEKI